MVERILHAAVFPNQLGRAFFPDALRAGNVVHGVAHQRHHVDHFFGRHTQNLSHFFLIDNDVPLRSARTRSQNAHSTIDELHHVLVVGDDQHFDIFLRRLRGHRANDVIGLISLKLEDRQTHRLAETPDVWQLNGHVIRHRRPLRFIFFEQLVTKCRALGVEHNADVVRAVVLDQPFQNVRKKKRHFGGQARRRTHAVHGRIKRPVDVRHGVHKKQFFRSRDHPGEYSKG